MNFPVAVGPRTRALVLAAVSLVSLAGFAACDENKGGGATTTTPSTSASTATTASASASATTTAMVTASATATDTAAPMASGSGSAVASASATGKPTGTTTAPTGTATGSATTTASAAPSDSAGAGAVACGGKDQPKCPMQAWMAGNMQPAMASKDPVKLAAALRASAKLAPPGYGDWAKYANDGAAAVEASKNIEDGKAACKNCHGAYQKRYRTEMRDRKI